MGTWQDGEADRSRKGTNEKPQREAGRPAGGPRRRRPRGGGGGLLAQIGLHPAAQSALLVPALVPRRHVEKGGGEEGRGQLSSYLEPDPSHPPRVGEGRRGEAADCGETGRSWEVSREMCQARSPREPKPEAVCVLPSLTLTLFLTILSLFSFQGGWELDPGPGSTPQDQAVAAKTEDKGRLLGGQGGAVCPLWCLNGPLFLQYARRAA